MTLVRRRPAILWALAAVELGFVIYFWPFFMRIGANFYILLDRHVADCALSGCPKVPLW